MRLSQRSVGSQGRQVGRVGSKTQKYFFYGNTFFIEMLFFEIFDFFDPQNPLSPQNALSQPYGPKALRP